jgi:nucleoid-associated protein YgaU
MAAVVIAPTAHCPPRRITAPSAAPETSPAGRLPLVRVVPSRTDGRLEPAVYWRRRAAAIALGILVVFGVVEGAGQVIEGVSSWRTAPTIEPDGVTGSSASSSAAPVVPSPPSGPSARVYVVEQGDTLWSIARRLDPGGDPRPIVDRLAGQAGGSALRPGQRLSLDGIQ